MKLVRHERINERIVDVPVSQIFEETVEMESQDQNLQRVVEKIVVCLVDVTGLHQRGDAGRRLSPEATSRRVGAGRRQSLRARSRRGKSCIGGTGSMTEGWSPGEPEVGVGQKCWTTSGAWKLAGD